MYNADRDDCEEWFAYEAEVIEDAMSDMFENFSKPMHLGSGKNPYTDDRRFSEEIRNRQVEAGCVEASKRRIKKSKAKKIDQLDKLMYKIKKQGFPVDD